jgi:glycosyltransferase involved in cell wall biosynthesis
MFFPISHVTQPINHQILFGMQSNEAAVSARPSQTSSPSHVGAKDSSFLPLVTIITPAFNEEVIISENLAKICAYMSSLQDRYRYEVLVVNDGSQDQTGPLADAFAKENTQVRVIHHQVNRNLGGALRTGFSHAQGDIVIVLDLDLSYSVDHIDRMLREMEATDADIVVASPYMKGGKNTKVPKDRLILSKVVNRIMRVTASTDLHTFTSMVRAYKRDFLRQLNLKSNTYSIMPEIIQKALILRGRVVEIPAHLDWSFQEKAVGRSSSIRIFKGILAGLMSSFIFRPYAMFMSVGTVLMVFALYMLGWIFFHVFDIYSTVEVIENLPDDRFSVAISQVFSERPHVFLIAGITLMAAFQFLGIGFLSLQNKRYFDELFHISSNQLRRIKDVAGS